MFARDIHSPDSIQRYYPKYQLEHFERDMFFPSKRLLHSVLLSAEDQKKLQSHALKATYLTIGTLSSSILALFLYNRIPLIRRVQRRGRRILLKCLMVAVPYVAVNMYVSFINSRFLVETYEKFKTEYRKYKEDGDIKLLNPSIMGIF